MKKLLYLISFLTFFFTGILFAQQSAFYGEYQNEFSRNNGWSYSNYKITAMGKISFLRTSKYNVFGLIYFRQTDRVSQSAPPSIALGGVEFGMKYIAFQFLAGVNNSKLGGNKGRIRGVLFIGDTSPKKRLPLKTYFIGSVEAGGPTGWYLNGRINSVITEWLSIGVVADRNERDNVTSDTGYGFRTDIYLVGTPIKIFGMIKWRWWKNTARNNIIGVIGTRLTF